MSFIHFIIGTKSAFSLGILSTATSMTKQLSTLFLAGLMSVAVVPTASAARSASATCS